MGVSQGKEYKTVIWKCHLHSYNRNSNLHFTIETVVDCRKYHLPNCKRDSHLHKYNKNCQPHIWTETVTCIIAAEIPNWIIATETFTCMIAPERSTNITVIESTTCKVAIEPQNLQNCNRPCHLHKYSTLDPLGA